ncbi:MAG: sigma-70 family RNA polymerase sigma factor [Acidobacteriota bacterium]|jgi:RNA polymerase sigma-70 factor (ECF subfamily)
MDLAELLERCRRGDELAWEALVRRYQGRVYGLALHYVRDADEARDLAQEVFVRIYAKLGTFRGHETFVSWMLRLARNLCIDHLRRVKARVPVDDVNVDEGPELRHPGAGPEAAFAADARKRLVYRALGKLSESYREIILLKDIQGLKIEEIATMLGLPAGTVKSRSNRARIELARAVLELSPAEGAGPAPRGSVP